MSTITKRYTFGGLDLRTNDLYRAENSASDCRNVRLDSNRRLIKREDYDETIIPRGTDGETGDFTDKLPFAAVIIDILEYKSELILVCNIEEYTVYYTYQFYTNTVAKIPFRGFSNYETTMGLVQHRPNLQVRSERVQSFEQNDILYILGRPVVGGVHTDPTAISTADDILYNRNSVYSYDGQTIGLAGCPKVFKQKSTWLTGDKKYVRLVPVKMDAQGRAVMGDYLTTITAEKAGVGYAIPLDYLTSYEFYGDTQGAVSFCTLGGDKIFNASDSEVDRTTTILAKTIDGEYSAVSGQYLYGLDYELGDALNQKYPTKMYRVRLKDVEYTSTVNYTASGTVILEDFQVYGDNGWEPSATITTLNHSTNWSNILVGVYWSDNETYGYEYSTVIPLTYAWHSSAGVFPYVSALIVATDDNTSHSNDAVPIFTGQFTSMYDESTVKLMPPKATSLLNYAGAMVLTDGNQMLFSDLSLGGGIETFVPFDVVNVGTGDQGKIMGAFGNETFLAVMREREIYYISGNIFLNSYRIQSTNSTEVGCVDAKSITGFNGQGVFRSNRGLYAIAQGGRVTELTDKLEPLFVEGALDNFLTAKLHLCKPVIDEKRELLLFDFSDIQVVFSYYHNEWYLYDDLNTSGGICRSIAWSTIFSSDGINIFKINDVKRLDTEAYYKSTYETLGTPSLYKKFLDLWISTKSMVGDFTLKVKSFKDWSNTPLTDVEKSGEDLVDITQHLNLGTRSRSAAIAVGSGVGEQLIVDGYEFTYGDFSQEFKDV